MKCFFLLGLVLAAVSGCQSLGGLGVESPTASVQGVEVAGVTADGFRMDFDLDVANPNGFALPLTDTGYTVSLAGVEAASRVR